MNKNTKWFLSLGVAAIIGANGLAMAAVPSDNQAAPGGERPTDKSEFKHRREHKVDNTALLALLKIDEETLKAERKAGKSLVVIGKEHGVSEQTLKEFMVKQMTQRIETGIKAGKITAEQAEKMQADMEKRVTAMINGDARMHKGAMHGKHRIDNLQLLKLLNMDKETFRTEMKAGKSLIVIAKEHGVSEQALKDFMVKQRTERIQAGVKAGKLTADQAEKMKANINKSVSDMMKGEGRMHRGEMSGRREFSNPAILTLLNIDQETLKSEIKAGKTLVTIAKEHGITEQTLKSTMLAQMNQRIEDGVKTGRISADKAEKMKAGMEQRIDNMINGKGPIGKR